MNNRDQSLDLKERRKKMKLTANPNADALCLRNDTAVERQREKKNEDRSLLINKCQNFHTLLLS